MTSSEREPAPEQKQEAAQPDISSPHPWAGPSPEAKAAAEPAKDALKEAISGINTPEQADQVATEVLAAASGTTEKEVREQGAAEPEPAQAIQEAGAAAGAEKAPATLVEAAKQVAASSGETREALEQAIQEATNPEQQGIAEPETKEGLDMLREAILKQMKPYQALDARVFLAVNHLPHNQLTNQFMYVVTAVMNAGFGWVVGLTVAAALDHHRGRKALLQIVPPLWFATMTVEYPIKYYFRRQRPFADIVQAIAVGRKPGTYSFPSGHSAAAFAGAWLLRRHYPEYAPLWYAIAALVAFSRIYLGAHYPGDVLSGAVTGTALAEAIRWVIDQGEDLTEPTIAERLLESIH
jgi:undecaprenyl-diphosphatase